MFYLAEFYNEINLINNKVINILEKKKSADTHRFLQKF